MTRNSIGTVTPNFCNSATTTVALLFLWPSDMQNTRMDALKWGGVFWKLYWWLFVPCSAVAGVLSVTIALRTARPPAPRPPPEP